MKTNLIISRYDKGYLPINFNLKQLKEPDRLTQIVISVNVKGKRIRVYSRMRIEPEFWDIENKRCYDNDLLCIRVRKRTQEINANIDEIKRRIEYEDHILAEKGRFLSAQVIRDVVLTTVLKKKTDTTEADILSVMKKIAEDYNIHLNRRGMIGVASTGTTYLMALGRLENFLNQTGRKLSTFNELDKRFFTAFAEYLNRYTFTRGKEKKNYTALTVASTLSAIRNIMHKAYDLGLCDNTYFDRIGTPVPQGATDKIYLTESEIARLAKVKTNNPFERHVLDMFTIASYTALRISDLNKLNEALITKSTITLCQTKTKSPVHIPILKEIAEVIQSYKDSGFPIISIGQANVCIKSLAQRAGITEQLLVSEIRGGIKENHSVPKYTQISFHTARRSCITNLFKRGYSANYIMTLSGHKSIASFQRYVRSSAEELSNEFIHELKKRKAIQY